MAWSPGARNHKLCGGRDLAVATAHPRRCARRRRRRRSPAAGEPRRRGRLAPALARSRRSLPAGAAASAAAAAGLREEAQPERAEKEEEEEGRGGARGGGWSPGQPRRARPSRRRRRPRFRPGSGRTCSWGWARARAAGPRARGALSTALRTPRRPPRRPPGAGGMPRPAWVAGAAGGAASRNGSKCWTASSPPRSPTCAARRRSLWSPAALAGPSLGPRCAAGSAGICFPWGRGRGPPPPLERLLPADAPQTRLPLRPPPHPRCPPRPSRPRGGTAPGMRARGVGAPRRTCAIRRVPRSRAPPAWSSCSSRRRCRLALSQPRARRSRGPRRRARSAAAAG